MNLRVTIPFAEHSIGDLITDADQIAAILESDAHRFVVRVAAVVEPEVQPET